MNCGKIDNIPTSTSKYRSIKNHLLNRTVKANSSNHHQSKDDEVEFKKSKKQKIIKIFGPDFLICLLKNEPQSYSQAIPIKNPFFFF